LAAPQTRNTLPPPPADNAQKKALTRTHCRFPDMFDTSNRAAVLAACEWPPAGLKTDLSFEATTSDFRQPRQLSRQEQKLGCRLVAGHCCQNWSSASSWLSTSLNLQSSYILAMGDWTLSAFVDSGACHRLRSASSISAQFPSRKKTYHTDLGLVPAAWIMPDMLEGQDTARLTERGGRFQMSMFPSGRSASRCNPRNRGGATWRQGAM
jgi:hypothetical protein